MNTKNRLPEINILLIGETGSGKSTTLNALANYLMYGTYQDASYSVDKFCVVAPSKFVLPDPATGLTRVIVSKINIGTQFNVQNEESDLTRTKYPVGYTFVFPGLFRLRIIDTPGIGDTGGGQKDNENFQNIISYLQQFEFLHGVVFVIKGNEARKTIFFKYCITELMTHLHRSVSTNIMFLFTHSRETMYGAGSCYGTLKSFIENELDIPDLKLVPNGQKDPNCFFIDNEAFRFLLAKQNNYQLPAVFEEIGQLSWHKSVKQISAMIERLLEIEPHNLRNTISLYNVRKIIIELAQQMVEFQSLISESIGNLKIQEELKAELDIINDCNTKFTYILATNSQMMNNKYYMEYLDHLISEEYQKGNPNPRVLKKMQSDYEKSIQKMKNDIKNKSLAVTIDDVPKLKEKFLSLKHSGKQLQTNLETIETSRYNRYEFLYDHQVANVSHSNVFFELFKKKFG